MMVLMLSFIPRSFRRNQINTYRVHTNRWGRSVTFNCQIKSTETVCTVMLLFVHINFVNRVFICNNIMVQCYFRDNMTLYWLKLVEQHVYYLGHKCIQMWFNTVINVNVIKKQRERKSNTLIRWKSPVKRNGLFCRLYKKLYIYIQQPKDVNCHFNINQNQPKKLFYCNFSQIVVENILRNSHQCTMRLFVTDLLLAHDSKRKPEVNCCRLSMNSNMTQHAGEFHTWQKFSPISIRTQFFYLNN